MPGGETRTQPVQAEEFLRWAAGVGIGFDPRYTDSSCLKLLPPADHARFWVPNADPASWPHFAASLLDGLDSWTSGFVWPRSGRWPAAAQSRSSGDNIRAILHQGAGVPDGWAGAVRFDRC